MNAEIKRLRDRLGELEGMHSRELTRLRAALDVLEQRMVGSTTAPQMPKVPIDGTTKKPTARAVSAIPVPVTHEEEAPGPVVESAGFRKNERMDPVIPEVPAESKPSASFELQFGRVWLVRLGIVLLVTGLVLLGNYAYRNWIRELPAFVRLAFLFAGSLGITGVGWHFTLKEGMKRFGEVLLAGGLAFFYWCAFAAHHVERLKVVESPVVASLMLLVSAGLIVGVSLKRNARATAVMGLLMASYSTVLQPLGWLSAVSNVVLAAAGMLLMRRRDWSGPGITSMVGTYGAFLWWQIAGASGGGPDRMGLFFLPVSWAVFSLPGIAGVAGSFSQSLTERGRAWFAGSNNGVFFGLFSLLWLMLGYENYWQVPAVFGLVILGLGAMGRSRESSGSTHVGQGLGMLTLALILKLDGYQLALGLAMEGLMLAVAFRRFRRPLELVFSGLAQLGSMLVVLYHWNSSAWVPGVAAVMVAASAVIVRLGSDRVEDSGNLKEPALQVTKLGMVVATVMAVVSCLNLDEPWRQMAPLGLSLLLAVVCLKWDRAGWLPGVKYMSLAFGVFASVLLIDPDNMKPWSLLVCFLISGAAAVFWERELGLSSEKSKWKGFEWMAWLSGLTAFWSLRMGIDESGWGRSVELLWSAVLAPGLAFVAMQVLRSPRLRTSISLFLVAALILALDLGERLVPIHFLVPLAALGSFFGARMGPVQNAASDKVFKVGTRVVALLGWCVAWVCATPEYWLEVLALSGAGLVIWKGRKPRLQIPEGWVLLVGTATGMLASIGSARWSHLGSPGVPEGWGVVVAFILASMAGPRRNVGGFQLVKMLQWSAAVMLALWSTLALVQSMGWTAAAIHWTLLGFGLVCSGLWLRVAAWRHAGFVLLGFALTKLFLVDVWDFAAFHRVVAFIALGAALVVLGFFYNRFAEILKRILEGDEA
ncbi:DUF2339 domain-containing protein [Haloferula sp.]|uniref:DUF2339 domain-containing protein n=1 Tax=Haloferula sp. TaxID=2497595 RepID=UPI00329B9DD4